MTDRFSLAGRHALVTGASSGLGRHFAGTLSAAGATCRSARAGRGPGRDRAACWGAAVGRTPSSWT